MSTRISGLLNTIRNKPITAAKKEATAASFFYCNSLIAQSLDRIEQRGLAGRIDAKEKADAHGKEEGQQHRGCRNDGIEAAEFRDGHGNETAKADADGRYTPESIWNAWKEWDFGQKKAPSPYLTYLVANILN